MSLNEFLFFKNAAGSIDTNQNVFDLLNLMKHKYRLFLIVQVSKDGADDHVKAKSELEKLVIAGVVKEHRVMYCTTDEGKKSMIRQLSCELHIETDPSLITGLARFMNKFHLVRSDLYGGKSAVAACAKEHADKVITFRSADNYA